MKYRTGESSNEQSVLLDGSTHNWVPDFEGPNGRFVCSLCGYGAAGYGPGETPRPDIWVTRLNPYRILSCSQAILDKVMES